VVFKVTSLTRGQFQSMSSTVKGVDMSAGEAVLRCEQISTGVDKEDQPVFSLTFNSRVLCTFENPVERTEELKAVLSSRDRDSLAKFFDSCAVEASQDHLLDLTVSEGGLIMVVGHDFHHHVGFGRAAPRPPIDLHLARCRAFGIS